MKCLIFSDTHGDAMGMRGALCRHPDAEAVFFLGDGISDFDAVAAAGGRTWFAVRGNCDFRTYSPALGGEVPTVGETVLLSRRIVFCHGHTAGAKAGVGGLLALAEERGADILLFGHTHTPLEQYFPDAKRPVWLFNPGSASFSPSVGHPTFGILTLTENSVLFSHGVLR